MTNMGLTRDDNDAPRWADCPLEPRVRQMETDMAVMQNDMGGVKEDIKPLPELAKAVSNFSWQVKISWGLTMLLIAAVIVNVVVIVFGGTP